ncbi:MAG: hypothetical protein PHE53_00285 [Thermoguttaceae bacterium]|nr:hypothetical protein [Thermoguttaceae bacterium]
MKKWITYAGYVIFLGVCFVGYGWYRDGGTSVDPARDYCENKEGRGPLESRYLAAITEQRPSNVDGGFISNRGVNTRHGENGDANGSEKGKVWNDWNIVKVSHHPERQKELDQRYRLPAQRLYPRDLRLGGYHNGAEPLDIFRRITVRIKGVPMMHASGGGPAVLTDDAGITDLAIYVRLYHTP